VIPGLTFLEFVGSRLMALFGYLGEVVIIITGFIGHFASGLLRMKPVTRSVLWKQVQFTGVDAMPFTGLLALLTALSVVVQIQLVGLGQSELFGKLMVVVLVRELGPIIVALVVLARSGTAIATEMATMRVANEIHSLRLSGIDPFDYLVMPRLGGMAVSLFCLAQVFMAISLLGGFMLSRLLVPDAPPFSEYVALITAQLSGLDAFIVALKTVVPGLLIGAIACREGMNCGMTYTEVPRATTRAVVRSFTAIFCWDALITTLIYELDH
jgi:phospholipid/cholesterol/gamma-HCH transport system permease protein